MANNKLINFISQQLRKKYEIVVGIRKTLDAWLQSVAYERVQIISIFHYMYIVVYFIVSSQLNYYYIGKDGRRMESWAVLFYITHL